MGFLAFDLLSGGTPDYAGEAQKAEDKRQAAIKKGTADINQAFAGFNPQFYDARKQAYIDFALPQLSDQYQQTRNQLGFGLANKGIQSSGAARKQWSDLFKTTESAKRGVVDSATAQAQDLQKQVELQKQTLLGQLYQSADPAGAQQAAISSAASLQAPSTFAPLVNQFSGLLNQYYVSQLLNQRATPVTLGTGNTGYGSSFAPLPSVSTSQDAYLPG